MSSPDYVLKKTLSKRISCMVSSKHSVNLPNHCPRACAWTILQASVMIITSNLAEQKKLFTNKKITAILFFVVTLFEFLERRIKR